VREVSWAQFGEVARELADDIRRSFRPDVILGVVNGGVFLGGALAASFQAEFVPVRIEKRSRIAGEKLPSLKGKRVLAVDDVTVSGQTLGKATGLALQAGATEVRTAALVVRPRGHKADFHAMETEEIVVFGWDYQLHADPGAGPVDPGEVGV
jgi:hypoxanthine phosphoribosyltransferase